MVTKDMLHAEIDRLTDEQVEETYIALRLASKDSAQRTGTLDLARHVADPGEEGDHLQSGADQVEGGNDLMSRLAKYKIKAPRDFARDFSAYASGEKDLGDVR